MYPHALVYPGGAKGVGEAWLTTLRPPVTQAEERTRRAARTLRTKYPNAGQYEVLRIIVERFTREAMEERQGHRSRTAHEPLRLLLHGLPGAGKPGASC